MNIYKCQNRMFLPLKVYLNVFEVMFHKKLYKLLLHHCLSVELWHQNLHSFNLCLIEGKLLGKKRYCHEHVRVYNINNITG